MIAPNGRFDARLSVLVDGEPVTSTHRRLNPTELAALMVDATDGPGTLLSLVLAKVAEA